MSDVDDHRALAEEWVRRFNTHDVASLVQLYAPHARHTSPRIHELHPETGGFLVGHAALTEWWLGAHQRTPGLRYEIVAITTGDNRFVIEYVRNADGEEPSDVAERFETEAGLIVSSRVFLG